MGLFSSSKKTYVSSTIYNLAGSIEDRPEYLKTVILGNILTNKRFKPFDVLQSAYKGSVGLRLRSYHRWARDNYKQIGIPTDTFYGKPVFNAEAVRLALKDDYDITASIDWIDSGRPDIAMWGRQWMREEMPEKETSDIWRVDYIEDTGDALITFTDGTAPVLFTPEGFRPIGNFLYISYSRPILTNRWSTPLLFIYEYNTGSAGLDTLFNMASGVGEYLPFIPLRHENKFISSTYKPAVYAEAKDAYKRAVGQPFDELIDKIKDNDSLDEIDFAYVFFGVSLNTKDKSSRQYIFAYFKHLYDNQRSSAYTFNQWVAGQTGVTDQIDDWINWYANQLSNPEGNPIVGVEPSRPTLGTAPGNTVLIQDKGPGQTNLKLEISWTSIEQTGGLGLGQPGAKSGDVWFKFNGSQDIVLTAYSEDEIEDLKIDNIQIYKQTTASTWLMLNIRGMVHRNHIYDGKSVEITAAQALLDLDESGFLIPIHYGVFRQLSLVDATQMGTQCVNLVFNSYQIVKKKWYQTGWFKVLLVIVIVAIAVVTGGVGAGGIGLLGANASVGLALGFAGIAATIAGVVANMVAAMILTKLISYVSVAVLGEKIGMIVAAIASMVALQVGTALQAGQSLATMWSSLTDPMNLLNMTNSVGNAYAGVLQSNTMEYVQKSKDALDDYRKQTLELQQNYAENIGYGNARLDPMALTGVTNFLYYEPSETFLTRTLLTGSEIAQMSQDMITDFVKLSLQNEFYED